MKHCDWCYDDSDVLIEVLNQNYWGPDNDYQEPYVKQESICTRCLVKNGMNNLS